MFFKKEKNCDILQPSERWRLSTKSKRVLLFQKDYEESRYKLQFLLHNNNNYFRDLIINLPVFWHSPEWGFPKGKRNKNESALDCAQREMLEETCVTPNSYTILDDIDLVRELFYGTDNKKYLHTYFVARVNDDQFKIPKVNNFNLVQTREVSAATWANIDEIRRWFRPYNVEKINVIEKLNDLLSERFQV